MTSQDSKCTKAAFHFRQARMRSRGMLGVKTLTSVALVIALADVLVCLPLLSLRSGSWLVFLALEAPPGPQKGRCCRRGSKGSQNSNASTAQPESIHYSLGDGVINWRWWLVPRKCGNHYWTPVENGQGPLSLAL